MSFIADTSVTLPWCFADEATPWTEALLNRLAGGEPVVVPAYWSIEVTNGLLMAVRRGRVTLNKVHEFIDDLNDMPVQIEPASSPDTWPSLIALAHQHRLTTYDAAYLELAQRTGLPLATLDRALISAARASAVPMET